MKVKCIKDTEGWWTEGEYYEAVESAGGFILVGDDEDPAGKFWAITPIERRDDGSIVYELGDSDGEVLFEEASHD
ncbi:hypothetical protein ABLU74_04630 [Klebsiella sp. GG_Kp161]|uniref:hypothetical protein n=1 Tax=Klebsiella sp. GG_Kp161 TaxID=3153472 RepID=UPI0032B4DAEA